jgi:hypothetical protein
MITVRKRDILFENQNKFFENQVHILVQTGHLYEGHEEGKIKGHEE